MFFHFDESYEKKKKHFSIFDEVDFNGQPAGNPDEQEPEDATIPKPVNAAGDDNANQDNPPPAEDQGQDAPPPDEGGGDEPEDFTQDAGGDAPAEGGDDAGGGEGDPEDFTGDAGGDEGDPEAEGGDEGGGGDAAPAGDGEIKADDARGMEQEIFKDLTPDQVDAKHTELKNNFVKLYDSTSNIIDRINDIPTSEQYTATIAFISNQLSDLRQMVTDYMNNVYSTKSYMENSINYNRFLATLSGINDILENISKEIDNNKEDQ